MAATWDKNLFPPGSPSFATLSNILWALVCCCFGFPITNSSFLSKLIHNHLFSFTGSETPSLFATSPSYFMDPSLFKESIAEVTVFQVLCVSGLATSSAEAAALGSSFTPSLLIWLPHLRRHHKPTGQVGNRVVN